MQCRSWTGKVCESSIGENEKSSSAVCNISPNYLGEKRAQMGLNSACPFDLERCRPVWSDVGLCWVWVWCHYESLLSSFHSLSLSSSFSPSRPPAACSVLLFLFLFWWFLRKSESIVLHHLDHIREQWRQAATKVVLDGLWTFCFACCECARNLIERQLPLRQFNRELVVA